MEEFSGKLLVQQEADGSSFPNGGVRNTFEARGYSAWDPSSPVFIVDDTLCIPTVFIAYTGEALDYKAPLLKSIQAVTKAALDVVHYFNPSVKKVISYLGWEQEYFLVDEGLYAARPDLLLTGRTLMGHEASKNQQLEDHYFGAIPPRVAAFMKDLEIQALELGIPVKTRHNEVAPNQFELAPIYEECNLAVDHNMLIMSLMRKVARNHGFRILLHEKPFKGVNGSGKHNNWSLGTDTGILLMAPGKTAEENLRFITFIVNTLMAVYRHNGLLKASIMSATNAHRLGANEAPPAIISSFLGAQLSRVLDHMEESTTDELIVLSNKHGMKLDIPQIPELLIDNTDRNRTSPFAFTGNKFEFRSLGSSLSISCPNIMLNTIVAEEFRQFADILEKSIDFTSDLNKLIRDTLCEHSRIIFNGNGYSAEWIAEAQKRGLLNLKTTTDAMPYFISQKNIELFKRHGVYTETEMKARYEIQMDEYSKTLLIEARTMADMVHRQIVPAVISYNTAVSNSVIQIQTAVPSAACGAKQTLIAQLSDNCDALIEKTTILEQIICTAADIADTTKQAEYCTHDLIPAMQNVRKYADLLETLTARQYWPFPVYSDLLFSE